jgi:hypothetical protein
VLPNKEDEVWYPEKWDLFRDSWEGYSCSHEMFLVRIIDCRITFNEGIPNNEMSRIPNMTPRRRSGPPPVSSKSIMMFLVVIAGIASVYAEYIVKIRVGI